MHAGVDLQLALKLHYKCIREKISFKDYKDENIDAEIPISNVNTGENLNAMLLGQVMHLFFVTKWLEDNGGLKIVKREATRNGSICNGTSYKVGEIWLVP